MSANSALQIIQEKKEEISSTGLCELLFGNSPRTDSSPVHFVTSGLNY